MEAYQKPETIEIHRSYQGVAIQFPASWRYAGSFPLHLLGISLLVTCPFPIASSIMKYTGQENTSLLMRLFLLWAVGMGGIMVLCLRHFSRHTILTAFPHGFGMSPAQVYEYTKITAIQARPRTRGETMTVCLDYETGPIILCHRIPQREAVYFAQMLRDLMKFRCAPIVCAVFGVDTASNPSDSVLYNPVAPHLPLTLLHTLQWLYIQPETCDSVQIERFLTCLLEGYGQQFIHNHVTVKLYGDPHALPPNLHNALMNLCKDVLVYHQQEWETAIRHDRWRRYG